MIGVKGVPLLPLFYQIVFKGHKLLLYNQQRPLIFLEFLEVIFLADLKSVKKSAMLVKINPIPIWPPTGFLPKIRKMARAEGPVFLVP